MTANGDIATMMKIYDETDININVTDSVSYNNNIILYN